MNPPRVTREDSIAFLVATPGELTPVLAGSMGCAFVPCPVFHVMSPAQQAHVQEIYRVAAERTREQLRPVRSRIPQFSNN